MDDRRTCSFAQMKTTGTAVLGLGLDIHMDMIMCALKTPERSLHYESRSKSPGLLISSGNYSGQKFEVFRPYLP